MLVVTASNMKNTIDNVKLVISLLDCIEEWRDLSLEKWNSKKLSIKNLLHSSINICYIGGRGEPSSG